MGRARDIASLLTTSSVLATDAEVASLGYLTNSSASSVYQTRALTQSPYRNIIINGDMQVAQRGTSVASITNSSLYHTADRWKFPTDNGNWTQSVENDAPTGSGFRQSLKMLCTSAASPSAAQLTYVSQIIEGQNLQQIAKGTASAKQLTLSFWTKANVTGTYTIWVYDDDNARQICASYTISTSATWEYKTVTFAADTTGILNNDNGASLTVGWNLSAGSNYTTGTLPNSWQSYNAVNRAVGQVNVAAANSNYWQITGVQLEVGDVATPFEFKPFDQDLRECQRYYQKSFPYNTTPANNLNINGNYAKFVATGTNVYNQGSAQFFVPLRANPSTVVFYTYNSAAGRTGNWFTDTVNGSATGSTAAALADANTQNINVGINGGNGFNTANTYGIHWTVDSEL